MMAIHLPEMVQHAKQVIMRQRSVTKRKFSSQVRPSVDVPRGHFAIYVGEDEENRRRFVVPIWYLNQPLFQDLLCQAAEEFGFHHGMQNLIIPCAVEDFIDLTSSFSSSTQSKKEPNQSLIYW